MKHRGSIIKKFLLGVLTLLTGSCATVQRDIYFRDRASKEEKTMEASFPGDIANIKISHPAGNQNVYLRLVSANRASGAYLFGILLPVIPVFFIPGNKFRLDGENLSVDCYIQLFSNTIGKCQSLKITTDTGQVLEPLSRTERSNAPDFLDTHFVFNIKASNLKRFKITDITVKFDSEKELLLRENIEMELEDWTRYYLPRIAP